MMTLRKDGNRVAAGLVLALNALRRDTTVVGTRFHSGQVQTTNANDPSLPTVSATVVTAATAVDLPTAITLLNNQLAVIQQHVGESISVHLAADPTAVAAFAALVALPPTALLTAAQTQANAIKAAFNVHLSQAGVHFNNDGTNTIATANATDQTTLNALANAMTTKIVAHMASAPAGFGIALSAN